MLKMLRITAAITLVAVMAVAAPAGATTPSFKNIIVLVPDGCGSPQTTIARWFKGAPLALDQMNLAGVRTYGAESIITDSAPAATAFACGYKTSDKFIGMLPDAVTIPGIPASTTETKARPVASVLEGAKLHGKATGIIATSQIQHATPAGFSAHTPNRSDYNDIAEQQVYQGIDVVLGGGKQHLLPVSAGGTRTDNENLVEVLKARGYAFVGTRDEMLASTATRLWGAFAADDMAYDWDRPVVAPTEPSLAEMTSKAIDVLSGNPLGFFLFIEGSKVDWTNHANDPAGMLSDMLAFDDAVKVALDFARDDGDTLVLAFADHNTGGLSLGSSATSSTYSKLPLTALIEPLKAATITGEGVAKVLAGDRSEPRVREALVRYGISTPTAEELAAVIAAKDADMNYVVGPMLSRRSTIAWTTTGHTGEDLFLYHYGLDEPMGMLENTDIAHLCAAALGFELDEVSRVLFQRADEAFLEAGATMTVSSTDPANKVLVVQRGWTKLEIPVS
ncbi:MAG: alkaline phosphatase, partial [Thermoanaerobaculaceae bacterium]|nr:alkaline phosphatase [Thermoanaerobaculaceae bacterium]